LEKLPIPESAVRNAQSRIPPKFRQIQLPEWADEFGVEGKIPVPIEFAHDSWEDVDWWSVICWFIRGSAETEYERLHGPIHSYQSRLKDWPSEMWEYAWANRIGLFLRRWSAKIHENNEIDLFGVLPPAEIEITHDVDAVAKTFAIRVKQTAFNLFNVFRLLRNGHFTEALHSFFKAVRFAFSMEKYWFFEDILNIENEYSIKSVFNFYGGNGGWARSPKSLLFDPAYKIHSKKLRHLIQDMNRKGWQIGLHQSYDSWSDPDKMRLEKQHIERNLLSEITLCRQHWLRFSWFQTWPAQDSSGFSKDMTLGFNDYPGFRNGCALSFHPWIAGESSPLNIEAIPMILMDSHLYDYGQYSKEERITEINRWINEIKFTHGVGSIIWHQRVFSRDYNWKNGFISVLDTLRDE